MATVEQLAAAWRMLESGAFWRAEAAARATLAEAGLAASAGVDAGSPEDGIAAAWLLAGMAVAAMGEPTRAAPLLLRAAAMQKDADHPCVELGRLRPALPRVLVSRQFAACLALAPADRRLRTAFAGFLLDGDDAAAAADVLETPETAAEWHLSGMIHGEAGAFGSGAAAFRRAVDLAPEAAASWSNLGMMLKVEGRFAEAMAAHDRAVALAPDDHRLRVNRAVTLLKMGDWRAAWRDYESRLRLPETPLADLARLMPSLQQDERLDGRTVLALNEDGFGDTLHFLRYLPLLAERGARVVACVPRPLLRLMRAVPGVEAVAMVSEPWPAHDFVCPMFSLPRVFGTVPETVPPVPRLVLEAELVARWGAMLASAEAEMAAVASAEDVAAAVVGGGLRVGLVWAGQARPGLAGFGALDRRRSAGLAAMAPLAAVPGVIFVSLQAGAPARQARPAGMRLTDLMPEVRDFADTAAIIAGLDVVVTVDTSVAHLAGLMDKPVLLLDRYDGCWRWLSGRPDSPWYPKLTLFRQERPGDWNGPIMRVAEVLAAMAGRASGMSRAGAPRKEAAVAA